MSSSVPSSSLLPQDRSSSQSARRDPFVVLESLLASLSDSLTANASIQATVEAAAEALDADAAFWFSRSSDRVTALAGPRLPPPEWCATFARKLLPRVPDGDDTFSWANPTRSPDQPTAAMVCRTAKATGCLFALTFDADRRFEEGDGKLARLALKVLVAQRAQSQAGTKQLLLGLLHSLTTIIDAKDPYTAGHSERVARIAVLIGKQLGLTQGGLGDLYLAGLLHDVGKIGIRDEILQKSGRLTREEYEEFQIHPIIGERVVASIKPFDRLRGAVRHHHERWDGTGYPDRLGKEEIPVLARVLAVADACDAMMSPRRYRPGRSPLEIDAIFTKESGRQFDPHAVRAFMIIRHEVYPPIYQKGIGDSAFHAIDHIVENMTDGTMVPLPPAPGERR
jgi:HD-GYP domain-containing protein (c-di-GMP phosphodiesterase class II)